VRRSVTAMQQIGDWLEKLGMSEYVQKFAENDIDASVLPELTDQDLKDLGISLGHRRKMLRAIRDLSGASSAVTTPSASVETKPPRRDDAERRRLTVMFTDLVGSTALSTKLDPEDMRSVIGAYHKCVAETVAPFDGFVAKYMGDGVLIYFGYPQAHEDDAERAVRTGLALIEALNRLGERETAVIIAHIVGNKGLAPDVMTEIVERTDGIPLFVEEMTKAVLEAESEGEAQRTAAAAPSPTLGVPPSLHASLMARLDRLGPAKEVAQIGAAVGREFSHALLAAVARKPEAQLQLALDRLMEAGLPPHASYLFKHALVQDAAYSTLLREPRRALQARIADVLESLFTEIGESQPELLAHHCTEAGLIEKAAGLWGKAGQRSLERSALAEAAEQLTRALDQIGTLPFTAALRRKQIKFQVAHANALMHLRGYSSPETRTSLDHARLHIERAEALGESPEDPLLPFSVLYGIHCANVVAFDGNVVCDLASQFLALAEKQQPIVPLMIGHRIMASSLLFVGDIVEALAHLEQAIALYDPIQHRPLATLFGTDTRAVVFSWRALALWVLGYPDAAVKDADYVVEDAREIGQAATLMYALGNASCTHICCRNYAAADAQADEIADLADEKGSSMWKAKGLLHQGCVLALTGKPSHAVQSLTSGITGHRSTGATGWLPWYLSHLAHAYAELDQFGDAQRCIGEAMTPVERTNERLWEAEVCRTAGEIALLTPEPDAAKAESYFERALAVARAQQAKSWELRAAMSMARLWRDQGKRQQARDLLAPVYGWFSEGFDTLDLKEAKALMEQLKP
jgi:predicted ATPase